MSADRKAGAMSDDTKAMAKFVQWAMNCAWDDVIPDGGELQDKARELGLIVPEGDDWFVLSPDVKAALKAEG